MTHRTGILAFAMQKLPVSFRIPARLYRAVDLHSPVNPLGSATLEVRDEGGPGSGEITRTAGRTGWTSPAS